MALILKNITGSSVQIEDLGEITIPGGTQIEIDPIDRLKFARSEDLETLLSAGTLVLQHENVDLSIPEAIRLIQRISNLKLSESTVLAGQAIKELNLIGDYTLSIADGVATINFAPRANEGAGALLQPTFVADGKRMNSQWLWLLDSDLDRSKIVPYVVPFDSRLIGVTFTNKEDNADCDISIYNAIKNNADNSSVVYTMEVRNSRISVKSNITNGPLFSAGDKISVLCDDAGSVPEDITIVLYLLVIDAAGIEHSEKFETG